jgi:hypothetical protein
MSRLRAYRTQNITCRLLMTGIRGTPAATHNIISFPHILVVGVFTVVYNKLIQFFTYSVLSLAFKLTVLKRSIFLCLSIEFALATVILYVTNCTVHEEIVHKTQFYPVLFSSSR